MSMSSPVLTRGMVVGFSHFRGGQLFLLDPATGEVTWRGPTRRGEHASLVSWGDEVLVFTDDGWLTVYEVEDERLVELGRYRLGTSVGWSHPAVSDSRIAFRDGGDLVVVRLDQP